MHDGRGLESLRRIADPAPPDPAFLDRLYEDLVGELGFRAERGAAVPRPGWPARRADRPRVARRLLLVAAVVALTTALIGGALVAGAFIERQRQLEQQTLDRVRAAGVLRVAVRSEYPQVVINGALQGGFDVDVAGALATRLGVQPEVQATLGDGPIAGAGTDAWDVALPSRSLTTTETVTFEVSRPYYLWPIHLLAADSSQARTAADLAGATICVIRGSVGEIWLAGGIGIQTTGPVEARPVGVVPIVAASDDDCLAKVASGEADAAVSAALAPVDLEARPAIRPIGQPILHEERRVVVVRGPGSAAVISAIDEAIDEMHADGSLADISRRRFGGDDLTVIAP